jgi:hypothetical protein
MGLAKGTTTTAPVGLQQALQQLMGDEHRRRLVGVKRGLDVRLRCRARRPEAVDVKMPLGSEAGGHEVDRLETVHGFSCGV